MSKNTLYALSEYLTDKKPGFQFTVYDCIDWVKVRWPRSTPTTHGFGHLLKNFANVAPVGRTVANHTVYEVIA